MTAKFAMERSVDIPLGMGPSLPVSDPQAVEDTQDVALVAAAREGDRGAFGQLYNRYARMVHGILLTRVPPSEVADLVHDVFLRALRRLESLRDAAAFGGWLAMITRNCASDYYRHRPAGADLPEDLTGPSVETPGPNAEALAALEAIRSLPGAYRETLMLRLVEGMTGAEIAARTGLRPASVRVNLHRGMKQLREKLSQEARP